MGSIEWVKPNGTEITTNDREVTIIYVESLGWKRKKKKLGRKPKDKDNG